MQSTNLKRIESIDMLRGLVMIIMALDHTRDFFHNDAMVHDSLSLATTTPVLFFTRWITHFCAPVFVFLSGISASLSSRRKTKKEASRFLIKRGVWLIFVEIFIVTLGLTFNPFYSVIFLQVIWVIGLGMIFLGILMRFSSRGVILITGLILVFGHNLLDYASIPQKELVTELINIFFTAKFFVVTYSTQHAIIFLYAILPWAGLMMLGYGLSGWFINYLPEERKKKLLIAGLCVTAWFILLRLINQYGNPIPYSHQKSLFYTILSFINVEKYPPSLQYTCMTIGPALLLLSYFEHSKNVVVSFVKVYGRVPFFYYVLHFYILHTLLVITFYLQGYGSNDIVPKSSPFFFRPDNSGFSLEIVYVIWISAVLLLYFPCRWYSRYKKANKQKWWLHYL